MSEINSLVENIINGDDSGDGYTFLARLVYTIQNDLDSKHSENIVDAVIEYCFLKTMIYGDEYWSFIKKINNPLKV